MIKTALITLVLIILASGLYLSLHSTKNRSTLSSPSTFTNPINSPQTSIVPLETLSKSSIPSTKILNNEYQIFQTFNNCGPASLSMDLSYFGINKSQAQLGEDLRPYQVPNGDNDDKSVSLDELASEAEKFGLISYHRPNGNMDMLKQFIAAGVPVITTTILKVDDDIGHYRVVKGYDETSIIQDDSMQGHNIHYTYSDFNNIWQQFNYEYLVIAPKDKQAQIEQILGKNLDEKTAWQEAANLSENSLQKNPEDINAGFNLSVADYYLGDYQKSVDEYEKISSKLPFRTLWYQLEPVESYYKLGNYQKVFDITDEILNHGNRAYSEAYILRGKSYTAQTKTDLAKAEFDKARLYNKNLTDIPE